MQPDKQNPPKEEKKRQILASAAFSWHIVALIQGFV
jgi:hypothetical protein